MSPDPDRAEASFQPDELVSVGERFVRRVVEIDAPFELVDDLEAFIQLLSRP